jgi:hypothetical protein
MARHKDIVYSSRTRYTTDVYRRIHNLKLMLAKALEKVPQDQLSEDDRRRLDELSNLPEITILHIIYQQKAYEGHAKDYEFSGTSMREHWQSGYEDTRRTLKRQEWMIMPPPGSGGAGPRCAPPAGRLTADPAQFRAASAAHYFDSARHKRDQRSPAALRIALSLQ